MSKLFIRFTGLSAGLSEHSSLDGEWAFISEDKSSIATGLTNTPDFSKLLSNNSELITNSNNVVVIIPSDHILSLTCQAPGGRPSQIRQALPFIAEEYIAGDIADLHLATEKISPGKPVRCNLIEDSLFNSWLETLEILGLKSSIVISETELLPIQKDEISVLIDREQVLLKTEEAEAKIDRDNLSIALSQLKKDQLMVLNGELKQKEAIELSHYNIRYNESSEGSQSALIVLAKNYVQGKSYLNLLQGKYAQKIQITGTRREYRLLGMLVVGWASFVLLASITQAIWTSYNATELEGRAERLYRDIYPQAGKVTNLKRQMQARMATARSGNQAADLMYYLQHLATSSVGAFRIDSLNYTSDRNELTAELILTNYEMLDAMEKSFALKNVQISIISAEQQEIGLRTRIRLNKQ